MEVPQNGWFTREHPRKMDDSGVPLFQETSISAIWYETFCTCKLRQKSQTLIWAVFKIPVLFHYTGWFLEIPPLDYYNPQYMKGRISSPNQSSINRGRSQPLLIHEKPFRITRCGSLHVSPDRWNSRWCRSGSPSEAPAARRGHRLKKLAINSTSPPRGPSSLSGQILGESDSDGFVFLLDDVGWNMRMSFLNFIVVFPRGMWWEISFKSHGTFHGGISTGNAMRFPGWCQLGIGPKILHWCTHLSNLHCTSQVWWKI